MSLELHEWDIHIVCSGTGGVGVTRVGFRGRVLPHRDNKLIGTAYAAIDAWTPSSEPGLPQTGGHGYFKAKLIRP